MLDYLSLHRAALGLSTLFTGVLLRPGHPFVFFFFFFFSSVDREVSTGLDWAGLHETFQ